MKLWGLLAVAASAQAFVTTCEPTIDRINWWQAGSIPGKDAELELYSLHGHRGFRSVRDLQSTTTRQVSKSLTAPTRVWFAWTTGWRQDSNLTTFRDCAQQIVNFCANFHIPGRCSDGLGRVVAIAPDELTAQGLTLIPI